MSNIVITITDVQKDDKPSINIGIKFDPPPKSETDFTPAQLFGITIIEFIETNKEALVQALKKEENNIIIPKMCDE